MTTTVYRPAETRSVRIVVPQGWPEAVLPPGSPGWQDSASEWLVGCCPPEYRHYPVLRRHPTVVARFAADVVEEEIRTQRALRSVDQPSLLDDEAEELRLRAARKAIALIEEALRGKIFLEIG